jgi:hypothetical protein
MVRWGHSFATIRQWVDTNLGKFVLICCRHGDGDDDGPEAKLLLIKAAAAAMAACRWITTAPFFVFAFSFHTTDEFVRYSTTPSSQI